MIENFGGMLNFVVFIALTLGWAAYAFQMSFGINGNLILVKQQQ